MGLTASSLVVELNISVWTANKLDRRTTDTVTDDNNASRDAVRVHKNLLAGTSARKEIADYAAACRMWHNQWTLPWADRGGRLLPTSSFFAYKTEANARRDTFTRMVQEFLGSYPNYVRDAPLAMGALFDASDYPDTQTVASKFDFRLVFSPVPEAGDFRVDVGTAELEELKKEYAANFDTRIAEAMREPWDRLHKLLTTMSAKLTDTEGDDTKKRYHDSLITNASTLCEMLTHLNITKDPQLEAARRQLEAVMVGADIDTIKEDASVRANLKERLDGILKKYEW